MQFARKFLALFVLHVAQPRGELAKRVFYKSLFGDTKLEFRRAGSDVELQVFFCFSQRGEIAISFENHGGNYQARHGDYTHKRLKKQQGIVSIKGGE